MKKILFIFILLLFTLSSCKKKDDMNPHKTTNECSHENKSWVTIKDSTCLERGSKNQICDDCGIIITTAFISLKDHHEVIDERIEPTCTLDGYTIGSHCDLCNSVLLERKIIPAKGHSYILDTVKSSYNILVYSCDCGDSYEEINNDNKECLNHESGDWVIIEDSTCTSLGYKEKRCIYCNLLLQKESIELKEHTEKIIEAINPTCYDNGLSDGIICSKCNKVLKEQEVINKLNHDYEITDSLNPTAYEKGYIVYTCSMCKYSYTEELDALGDYNPTKNVIINLSDSGVNVKNNNGGVSIEGSTIRIALPGEYDISGTLSEGNIIIAINDDEKAVINLIGVNIKSSNTHPIYIESGNEIDISVKSDTINYLYDQRTVADVDAVGGAIYAKTDIDIKGKGTLNIESTYNNGIATTKDLTIKNLTLNVNVPNNALKGNDSVTIESGTLKLISSSGDAIKTENSDVSEKGNQRGIIHIIDGDISLYAACDGIDASYDVIIDGGDINIYTEKYSEYSGDVEVSSKTTMYLRLSSRVGLNNNYKYSAQFVFEDQRIEWVNGVLDSGNPSKYYKFDVPNGAKYVRFYAYNSTQTVGQNSNYAYATDQLSIPSSYDTFYVTSISSMALIGDWTSYSLGGGSRPGGTGGMPPGGMPPSEGNDESALYSCKGVKADNSVIINNGNIKISSHDDSIHANSDVTLENGSNGTGDVTINGGLINITTEDDGIHSDNVLNINGGNVLINKSYEAIEGLNIYFKSGTVQIKSNDDGINAKSALYFQGSIVYLDAGGDGIDSNGSVYMSGGVVLATGPTNGGNGVIDIGDRGYTFSFTGGLLLAIGCSGMDVSPTGSNGNTVSASRVTSSINTYLTIESNGEIIAVLKVTKSSQTYRVFAYNNESYPSCKLIQLSSTSVELTNGLYYVKNN